MFLAGIPTWPFADYRNDSKELPTVFQTMNPNTKPQQKQTTGQMTFITFVSSEGYSGWFPISSFSS